MSSPVHMRQDHVRTLLIIHTHHYSSRMRHIHIRTCRWHPMPSGYHTILERNRQIDNHFRHGRLHHPPSVRRSSQQCNNQIDTHIRHGRLHHSPSVRRSRTHSRDHPTNRFWAMSSPLHMRWDHIRNLMSMYTHQHSSRMRHIQTRTCRWHPLPSG